MESLAPFNTILLYPGRCTMFNMVRVQRMKKNKGQTEEEITSELWEIEDEDDYLIVRVLYTSHPWLVIHRGVNEIAKAPLVLFIEDEDIVGNKVSLTLRDSSNRGCQCIKRKFILEFHSGTDAMAFQAVHNLALQEHAEKLISCQDNERKLANEAFIEEMAVHNLAIQEHAEKLVSCQENERKLTDEAFMKERFERGDENNVEDDNNMETQNPWDDDDYLL